MIPIHRRWQRHSACDRILQSIHLGTALYAGSEARSAFAGHLAAESGVALEIVKFGLLGDPDIRVSVGAARNAALIECSGSSALFLDDDIRCQIGDLPISDDRVSLGARPECFGTWFYMNFGVVQSRASSSIDLLGLHERLLSFDRCSLDEALKAGAIDLDGCGTRLLHRFAEDEASVVISSMGVLGDPGIDNPLPYYVGSPEDFTRLTQTPEMYRAALRDRLVCHGAKRTVISEYLSCMAYAWGSMTAACYRHFCPSCGGKKQSSACS